MTDRLKLTDKERQALALFAAGHSDQEIATAMNCSVGVVRNRFCAIRLKLAPFATKPLNKRINLAEFHNTHILGQA